MYIVNNMKILFLIQNTFELFTGRVERNADAGKSSLQILEAE